MDLFSLTRHHDIEKAVHAFRRTLPKGLYFNDVLEALYLRVPKEEIPAFVKNNGGSFVHKFFDHRTAKIKKNSLSDRIDLMVALHKAGVDFTVLANLNTFMENVRDLGKVNNMRPSREDFSTKVRLLSAIRAAHPGVSMTLAPALVHVFVDEDILLAYEPDVIMSTLARFTHETGFLDLNRGLRLALANPDRYEVYLPYFASGVTDVAYIERCIADDIDAELAASAA